MNAPLSLYQPVIDTSRLHVLYDLTGREGITAIAPQVWALATISSESYLVGDHGLGLLLLSKATASAYSAACLAVMRKFRESPSSSASISFSGIPEHLRPEQLGLRLRWKQSADRPQPAQHHAAPDPARHKGSVLRRLTQASGVRYGSMLRAAGGPWLAPIRPANAVPD